MKFPGFLELNQLPTSLFRSVISNKGADSMAKILSPLSYTYLQLRL